MASIFSEGNVPKRWDTRWSLLMKILGATAEGGGGSGSVLSGPGPATSPPANPAAGAIKYNETTGGVEYWNVTLQKWE